MSEFPQYALQHDDGADILVDQVGDQVAVRQSSMGVTGRGPMLLTPNEAHELARQIEAAASAAARYTPLAPEATLVPTNTSPDVAQALRILGIDQETVVALRSFQEQLAAQRAVTPPQTGHAAPP